MASPFAGKRPRAGQERVAIVGTGLAGLTAAHLLVQDEKKRFNVTLFEQASTLSLDAASLTVQNGSTGAAERVDVPMRTLAGGYYENLIPMYRYLQIPMHATKFLFIFADADSKHDSGAYFIHSSNLHQGAPRPSNRSQLSHLIAVLTLLIWHFWFILACFFVAPKEDMDGRQGISESVDQYVRRIWLPRKYVTHYLLPTMSQISTCSHEEFLRYPASDLINRVKKSYKQEHYTVCGGVKLVESKLAAGIKDVRLNTRIEEVVSQGETGVTIRWRVMNDSESRDMAETFDRVVLAVPPTVAANLFSPVRTLLRKMPARQVESAVTDSSGRIDVVKGLTQKQICSHCSTRGGKNAPEIITLRTRFNEPETWTEALHVLPVGAVIETCPLDGVDEKKALKTVRFTRTLRDVESRAVTQKLMGKAQNNDEWMNGMDNVWLAGSWCWDGLVLLEGCVVSAMAVAKDLGVAIPWE